MNANPYSILDYHQQRAQQLQAEAARHRLLRPLRSNPRTQLALFLNDLAEKLEPRLKEPRSALR